MKTKNPISNFQKLLFLTILIGLIFPLTSSAGVYKAKDSNGVNVDVCYRGLVPCGDKLKYGPADTFRGNEGTCQGGIETPKNVPCQFCHFWVMFKGIVDWVIGVLVPVIAILMLMVGGVMFFFGGNSPEMLNNAKNIIKSVIYGLLIIFSAYLIVNVILGFPGLVNFQFTGADFRHWFNFNCPITLPK